MRSWRLNDRVGMVAESLKGVSSEGVRLDFNSFAEPEKQLFWKVWEINEKYGSSPPDDVLLANAEFIFKAREVLFLRITNLFMVALRLAIAKGEVEEWFMKLHFYNFLEDLSECLNNVRRWSEQDRAEFLRDMKENGWEDKVFRIPRNVSHPSPVTDEKKEQEGQSDERA